MKFIEKRITSVVISVSVLMIAFSVAYYLVIFLPSKNKDKKESEQNVKQKELQIYESCDSEAGVAAKELLKSKIEVAEKSGVPQDSYRSWKEAAEKDLLLKDDYNELYNTCLRRHGVKY